MFFKRYGNLVLGCFFMLLAVVYYFLADALPPSQVMSIGPAFVPKIVAGLTFAISLLLVISSVQKLKSPLVESAAQTVHDYWRVILTIVAFGVYVLIFERVGFLVSTFVYLLAQMPVMAPREKINIPLFIGIAAVTSGLVYYLFRFHLDVMLPRGILG